jgi:hypothetical protein
MWRFLKRAFTRDIPLKIGSVALALLIMILILAVRMERRNIQGVPVAFTDVPANMKPPQWDRKTLDVTLRGPREVLDEVTGKVVVNVSLEDNAAGTHKIRLSPEDVEIAIPEAHRKRIQIDNSIREWVVNVDLDQYEAWVPVATPAITGTPQWPYYSDPSMMELDPSKILVTGPPRVLQRIEDTGQYLFLEIGTIDIGGAGRAKQESYVREYRVDFESLGVKPVDPENDTVTVIINFEAMDYRTEVVVENVQVRNKPENADVTYRTEKIHVTVEGRESIIEALESDALTAWVDASKAAGAEDFVAVDYEVTAPRDSGVKIISWRPNTIDLKVVPAETENNRKKRSPPVEEPSG